MSEVRKKCSKCNKEAGENSQVINGKLYCPDCAYQQFADIERENHERRKDQTKPR